MSKFERDQERLFTRRAVIIGAGQLGAMGILTARMFQLQVLDHHKYMAMAEDNRVNMALIAPDRGIIVDRFDVPLAVNVQNFRVVLVPERTPDIPTTLDQLSSIVPISPERRTRIMRDIKRSLRFMPVLIMDNLTWEQMASIEIALPHLPGITIQEGKVRSYPLKDATAHVLGYVGTPNEKEVKADPNPLLQLPGFQMGKIGLEKRYDTILRGVAGKAAEEVNASGRRVRELKRDNGQPGYPLHLTLDAELQLFTQGRLAQERSASALVMDAHTGAIYAMASHPAYDPNVFSQGIPQVLWDELIKDPTAPMTNKIIAGQYPPGSTFKMVTGLAALEAGVLNEHRGVYCPGHMNLGNHRFHCWKKGGHGTVNLREALSQSCDVFFYQMALDVGIDRIASVGKRLGLGERLGLDIPGEMPGIMPNQAWKKNRYQQSWQLGDSLNCAIGQGYVLTTPLQLAVMTARLVNGGVPIEPFLAQQIGEKLLHPTPPQSRLGFDPAHIALIKEGMDAVINSTTGTARAAAIKDPNYSFGGKTGTSQVRRITMEQRARGFNSADLEWQHQHHALFVGYGPVEAPRYSCAVVVEHGASGSSAAAPIARDLLMETQRRSPEKQRLR